MKHDTCFRCECSRIAGEYSATGFLSKTPTVLVLKEDHHG